MRKHPARKPRSGADDALLAPPKAPAGLVSRTFRVLTRLAGGRDFPRCRDSLLQRALGQWCKLKEMQRGMSQLGASQLHQLRNLLPPTVVVKCLDYCSNRTSVACGISTYSAQVVIVRTAEHRNRPQLSSMTKELANHNHAQFVKHVRRLTFRRRARDGDSEDSHEARSAHH